MRVVEQLDEAFEALHRAQRLAESSEDAEQLSAIHFLMGNLYYPRGQINECLGEHQQALEYARQARSSALELQALGGLCDANYLRGSMVTANELGRECVDLAESQGLAACLT